MRKLSKEYYVPPSTNGQRHTGCGDREEESDTESGLCHEEPEAKEVR